jgi:monoamine oxidase
LPDIRFSPEPGDRLQAARFITMGDVQKVVFIFKEPLFPRPEKPLQFIFATEMTFHTRWLWNWKQEPFILTCWSGGKRAEALRGAGEHAVIESALRDLSTIHKLDFAWLKSQVDEVFYHDWVTDPHSRGAYSYVLTGGEGARQRLAEPVEDTLFFAGEATDSGAPGTVQGALRSGKSAAATILRNV